MNGYWQIGFIVAALLIGLIIGNRVTTWHYEAKLESAAVQAANQATTAQSKIIAKTQIINHYIHDSKSTCINQPIDPLLLQQLR